MDWKRFYDREMCLITGKGKKVANFTFCERSYNYLPMTKIPSGKRLDSVVVTAGWLSQLHWKNLLFITSGSGTGFRLRGRIAESLNTTIYFAGSYTS
ncbi:MAG: hypothetical protein NC324_01705 [Bacteroides sp.]|nr:hypothetical protein [Bacteroides sp.]